MSKNNGNEKDSAVDSMWDGMIREMQISNTPEFIQQMPVVSLAYLHTAVSAPGLFMSTTTIATVGDKKIPDLTVYLDMQGNLRCFMAGKQFIIGASNVKIALLK